MRHRSVELPDDPSPYDFVLADARAAISRRTVIGVVRCSRCRPRSRQVIGRIHLVPQGPLWVATWRSPGVRRDAGGRRGADEIGVDLEWEQWLLFKRLDRPHSDIAAYCRVHRERPASLDLLNAMFDEARQRADAGGRRRPVIRRI